MNCLSHFESQLGMSKMRQYPKIAWIVLWVWTHYRNKASIDYFSKDKLYRWAEKNECYKAATWFIWNCVGKTLKNPDSTLQPGYYSDKVYVELPEHTYFRQLGFLEFYKALLQTVRRPWWFGQWYADFPETRVGIRSKDPKKPAPTSLVQDIVEMLRVAGYVRFPSDFADDMDVANLTAQTVGTLVDEKLAGLKIALMPAIDDITERLADKDKDLGPQSLLDEIRQLRKAVLPEHVVELRAEIEELRAELEELKTENALFKELYGPTRDLMSSVATLGLVMDRITENVRS